MATWGYKKKYGVGIGKLMDVELKHDSLADRYLCRQSKKGNETLKNLYYVTEDEEKYNYPP